MFGSYEKSKAHFFHDAFFFFLQRVMNLSPYVCIYLFMLVPLYFILSCQ